MSKMIELSGASGGGQILRSALSLAMVTGRGFRLSSIRGKRPKPGLMRQHLTCAQAAAEVSDGAVDGAELGSREIVFQPGTVRAGRYEFAIGTAGSTTLLAQTLLPALWGAEGESELVLSGGTHNPMAPPMDFIQRVYLPALGKFGVTVKGELEKYGFAPAGGGTVRFKVAGGERAQTVEFLDRGEEESRAIECLLAHVPATVAEREMKKLRKLLDWPEELCRVVGTENSSGPGNALAAELVFAEVTERVTAFGAHGKSSERVAKEVAKKVKDYLASGAVVGRCLADQLMIPMALAGGGAMRTMHPSSHMRTNAEVIEAFLPVKFRMEECGEGPWEVSVEG